MDLNSVRPFEKEGIYIITTLSGSVYLALMEGKGKISFFIEGGGTSLPTTLVTIEGDEIKVGEPMTLAQEGQVLFSTRDVASIVME